MKKILTIILDGFGMREDVYGNAIKMAGMNNFVQIWNNYPHCLLKANGEHVNLPEGQCSCSSIGHKIIGTGRQIENKINELNKVFQKDLLKYNGKYNEMIDYLNLHPSNNIHIIMLLSDGGVISHIDHLRGFVNSLDKSKIKNKIYLHAISDGYDSSKYGIMDYLNSIEDLTEERVRLASVCGRYYALDTTRNYKRTKMFYELLFESKGVNCKHLDQVVKKCYDRNLSDEYLPPIKKEKFEPVRDKDVIMFLNFDNESEYQLLNAICNEDFVEFEVTDAKPTIYSLYEINSQLNPYYFFEKKVYQNSLVEYLASLGFSQAHIFESIRAKNMEYYLTGEKYVKLDNCEIYEIDSPAVDSFDQKPELSSLQVAKTVINCMEKDVDFIICNFANADVVGHTGNYQATINSLQAVDVCLGKIIEVAEENFYKIVLISGNSKADTIIDRNNNIITKNTLSPVPFVIMDNKIKLNNGNLSSFAPTLLKYMDLAIPKEMKETEILLEENKKK